MKCFIWSLHLRASIPFDQRLNGVLFRTTVTDAATALLNRGLTKRYLPCYSVPGELLMNWARPQFTICKMGIKVLLIHPKGCEVIPDSSSSSVVLCHLPCSPLAHMIPVLCLDYCTSLQVGFLASNPCSTTNYIQYKTWSRSYSKPCKDSPFN